MDLDRERPALLRVEIEQAPHRVLDVGDGFFTRIVMALAQRMALSAEPALNSVRWIVRCRRFGVKDV